MDNKYLVLCIFVLAYLLFVLLPTRRTLVAIIGSLLLIACKAIAARDPLGALSWAGGAINWNVMGIFVGTLAVADVFMKSRVPAYLAEVIVDKARNTCWSILCICLMTGFISAFVENVATVLIVAPIALALAKKLQISPMNMMIAIAVSSNLQGAATLIGDPPSMLLGGFTKMTFMDFFFYHGRPSIFFAVELGAIASFFVLLFIFRKYKEKAVLVPVEKVKSWIPTYILVLLIILLACSSFFDKEFSCTAGIMCMIAGVVCMVWEKLVNKASIIQDMRALDWDTTFFLMGVFVMVGSLTTAGWIEIAADFLSKTVGTNVFLAYTIVVFLAVILSAFIDNVPFLAAMLPLGVSMSGKMGIEPSLLLFGLLIGASLGGNVTPIGASANIVACGLLKKEGCRVTFRDFMKIGVPFTFVAVLAAYLFVWFVWSK